MRIKIHHLDFSRLTWTRVVNDNIAHLKLFKNEHFEFEKILMRLPQYMITTTS